MFGKIGLIGRHADPNVSDSMHALTRHLLERGVTVLAEAGADLPGATPLSSAEIAGVADLLIVIGGDGSMLHACRLAAGHDVPLLGINRGRLGFLTDIGPEEMLDRVDEVLAGRAERERRLMLMATIERDDGSRLKGLALNDVVLQKGEVGRMIEYETWIDGRYVNTHGGDGVIVATPTGSTAYALSCNGPILAPELESLALVPICPHTLSDRPIVVPARVEVEVRLAARADTAAHVNCDGVALDELKPEDRLLVRAAQDRVTLLHPEGHDYYRILRSKLHWGRGTRVQKR